MSEIIPFKFRDHQVRTVVVNGDPWFIAKDVAELLGYSRPRDAVADHCKGGVKMALPSIGGIQEQTIIPERDVYRLILKSKMPEAESFEEWVVGEVLPSIRKTGQYIQPAALPSRKQLAQMVIEAEDRAERAEAQIEADRPKVELAMAVRHTPDTLLVREFAKVLGTGEKRFYAFLRDSGFLMSTNEPYQRFIDLGIFERKAGEPWTDAAGHSHVPYTTRITGKGQVYLERKWRDAMAVREAAPLHPVPS